MTTEVSTLEIERAAAEAFGVSVELMRSPGRAEPVVGARQVAMVLVLEKTHLRQEEVAALFGRTHGAVYHARRVVQDRCDVDATFRARMERLRAMNF